jgi:hypothetical protein
MMPGRCRRHGLRAQASEEQFAILRSSSRVLASRRESLHIRSSRSAFRIPDHAPCHLLRRFHCDAYSLFAVAPHCFAEFSKVISAARRVMARAVFFRLGAESLHSIAHGAPRAARGADVLNRHGKCSLFQRYPDMEKRLIDTAIAILNALSLRGGPRINETNNSNKSEEIMQSTI